MQSIKHNVAYNFLYQITIIILPIFTAPYLSRVLGVNGIGKFSFTYSIVGYFMIFAMLGISNYGNRTIASSLDNENLISRNFIEIYYMQFVCACFSMIFYFIFIQYFVVDYRTLFYIQGLNLFATLLDISWFYFGIGQFKLTVIRSLIIKVITVILIFIFINTNNDLNLYAIIMISGNIIGQLVLWFNLKKFIKIEKVKFKRMLVHLKPNFILFLPVIAISFYRLMDKIMLGMISGVNQVGFYENADKIIVMPLGLVTALGVVMLPKMSFLAHTKNKIRSSEYFENSIKFTMFLASAFCFGLASISDGFVLFFFGNEFELTGTIIFLLSPTILFIAWANVVRTQYLIPNKLEKYYIQSVFLGAIINFALNLVFIPKLGAIGATIGTISAEFTVCFYQTFKSKNNLNISLYLKDSKIFYLSGFIMFLVVYTIGQIFDTTVYLLVIQIFIGAIVYLSVIYFYIKYFDIKLLNLVKKELFNHIEIEEGIY